MPIRKDAATGWHFISYLVPVREKKRMRYQATPLTRQRASILDFFRDLFRGGANPFLASPIAYAIDRKIKLERQARRAERRSDAGAALRLRDGMEAQLRRLLHRSFYRADQVLDALDIETNGEEAQLEEWRPIAIKENFKGELEEILADVEGHLGPCARRFHTTAADHRKFMEDYGLDTHKSVHAGHRINANFLYSLIGVTVFEFILNTMFFSGSQKNGLIGGAALAMILSISTIFLGVCLGWSFQFSDTRTDGNGWRGRAGIVAFAFATAFYLLLLTLARRAGDAGDLDMFGTAAKQIQERPFAGILDLPALGYCFFTIGVITLVAWKFADTMGHFPRIRSHKLAVEDAEAAFESVRNGMAEELERRIDATLAKIDDVPSILQARKLALKEIFIDYENVVTQFYADIREMRDAQDLMVGIVRSYTGSSVEETTPDVGYDEQAAYFRTRLGDFKTRIENLVSRAAVSQSAIDRCRSEMTALGKKRRKELERECDALRRLPPQSHTPLHDPPTTPGNISWLREKRA